MPLGSILELSWSPFGSLEAALGALLGPSWGHLGGDRENNGGGSELLFPSPGPQNRFSRIVTLLGHSWAPLRLPWAIL